MPSERANVFPHVDGVGAGYAVLERHQGERMTRGGVRFHDAPSYRAVSPCQNVGSPSIHPVAGRLIRGRTANTRAAGPPRAAI